MHDNGLNDLKGGGELKNLELLRVTYKYIYIYIFDSVVFVYAMQSSICKVSTIYGTTIMFACAILCTSTKALFLEILKKALKIQTYLFHTGP